MTASSSLGSSVVPLHRTRAQTGGRSKPTHVADTADDNRAGQRAAGCRHTAARVAGQRVSVRVVRVNDRVALAARDQPAVERQCESKRDDQTDAEAPPEQRVGKLSV